MDDGSCRNDPIQDMIHDAFGYHPNDETMDEVGAAFDFVNDGKNTKEDILKLFPSGSSLDQWATFVEYRMSPDFKEASEKNKVNRAKQVIPHTGGSKSLARKKAEMEIEHGRKVSRGEVWIVTHKRSDGSAVNDAASVIIDKITSYEASGSCSSQEVSQYDSLAMALGSQEHSERVRGLGLGPTPSQVFGDRARGRSSDPTYTEMQNERTQLRRKVIENEEQTRLKDAKLERMQAFQTSLLQSLQGYLPSQVLQNLEALNEGISQSPPSCNQRDGQPPPDS
ncbi:uncharacterized protein G2W53_021913 [Senna tora]|uniref:Uncharacterized protein n=1 Tax=Senna tora TaxID=362788 RepID=A0A834TTM7_9FABA|nr:uncharacterized protein G2W53_021913 [Senna tora]